MSPYASVWMQKATRPTRVWRGRRLLTTHRHRIPVTTIQRTIDDLRAAGYTVLRFNDTQLEEEPERVAALVASELRASEPST